MASTTPLHPSKTPKITIEQVTPEMAATWLGTMKGNRNLRKKTVDAYARDMIGGRWLLNGEAVKFAASGRLVDGQHRLQAVIASKQTVLMTVVRGVDEAAMITLDTGAGRTFADWATIGGRSYAGSIGPVLRIWYKYEVGSPTVGYRPTNQELEALLIAHPQIIESTAFVINRKVLRTKCVGSVQGFVHAYASEHFDRELADLFMDELDSGVGLPPGSPVLALRRRLVDDAAPGRRVDPTHVLAWTIKAWNAWLAGEKLQRVVWAPQGVGTGVEAFPRFELRKARDLEKFATANRERRRAAKSNLGVA